MSVTMSSIQGWASQVQAALTSLPTELEQAAPTGGFAAVLAKAAATLTAGPSGVTTAATAASAGGGSTTAGGATAAGGMSSSLTGTGSPVGSGALTAMLSGIGAGTGTGTIAGGASGSMGRQAVAEATKFLGTPYVWGGSSPTGFDCSGLVQYVYGKLGVNLPRTTYTQVKVGTPVPSLTQAQPGDLVFFAGSDGTTTSPGHVGIYIGNGQMIDAPYTGVDVRIDPVGNPVAIRRVVPAASGAATAPPATTPSALASSGATIGSGVPSNLAPLFVAAAGKYGVPVTLLTAVARHESRFETNVVSSAGAEGIMQIMPGTAAGLGVTPFTPGQAIGGAARLLSGYLKQFGSVPLALAAYDAGAGAVQQYGGIPPYPETQAYVQTIMQTIGGAA